MFTRELQWRTTPARISGSRNPEFAQLLPMLPRIRVFGRRFATCIVSAKESAPGDRRFIPKQYQPARCCDARPDAAS
jgi:hypothetical protein